MDLWTPADEAEAVGRSEAAVSRARRDPTHPAYQHPDGTFADPRTRCQRLRGGRGGRMQILAPADVIREFWAARKPGRPTQGGDQS